MHEYYIELWYAHVIVTSRYRYRWWPHQLAAVVQLHQHSHIGIFFTVCFQIAYIDCKLQIAHVIVTSRYRWWPHQLALVAQLPQLRRYTPQIFWIQSVKTTIWIVMCLWVKDRQNKDTGGGHISLQQSHSSLNSDHTLLALLICNRIRNISKIF